MSIPVPAKYNSLKALYVTVRGNDQIARMPDDATRYGLTSYTCRIGSRVIPSEPMTTTAQFVSETERAFGSASSRISPSSYDYSQVTTDLPNTLIAGAANAAIPSSCFTIGIETESYSSAQMGSVYQGLNTSTDDIFFQPTFGPQADLAVKIDVYASYDQLITIDNGVVSVQY